MIIRISPVDLRISVCYRSSCLSPKKADAFCANFSDDPIFSSDGGDHPPCVISFESMHLYELDLTLADPKVSVQRGFNRIP